MQFLYNIIKRYIVEWESPEGESDSTVSSSPLGAALMIRALQSFSDLRIEGVMSEVFNEVSLCSSTSRDLKDDILKMEGSFAEMEDLLADEANRLWERWMESDV